jgi:hypothetical protein
MDSFQNAYRIHPIISKLLTTSLSQKGKLVPDIKLATIEDLQKLENDLKSKQNYKIFKEIQTKFNEVYLMLVN